MLGYTGQEKESDLGLYYYGARFYDPDTGRFLSVDAKREFWNSYSYVGNNQIIAVDPTGNEVFVPYDDALELIRGSVREDLREFIQVDENGFIDTNVLAGAINPDDNFYALEELANSNLVVEVFFQEGFEYKSRMDGGIATIYFNEGYGGQTLAPFKSKFKSKTEWMNDPEITKDFDINPAKHLQQIKDGLRPKGATYLVDGS